MRPGFYLSRLSHVGPDARVTPERPRPYRSSFFHAHRHKRVTSSLYLYAIQLLRSRTGSVLYERERQADDARGIIGLLFFCARRAAARPAFSVTAAFGAGAIRTSNAA